MQNKRDDEEDMEGNVGETLMYERQTPTAVPRHTATPGETTTNLYGDLRDLMDPERLRRMINSGVVSSTTEVPTPSTRVPPEIFTSPGGSLQPNSDKLDPIFKEARTIQADFRARKITNLQQFIAHWPDMQAQLGCLGRIGDLIDGTLEQDKATKTEITVASAIIQSMCSDVEAVTSYLYRWRVQKDPIDIRAMFTALKQGLGGHNEEGGEQALDDARAIRYTGGLVTTTLRKMDGLFALIAEHQQPVDEPEKLRILKRAFIGHETFRQTVKFGHYKTYFDLCTLLQKEETELANAGCAPAQSSVKKSTVAYAAATLPDRRKVYAFRGPCFICGETGHKAAECSKAVTDTPSQSPTEAVCQICQKPGHLMTDCIAKLVALVNSLNEQVKKVSGEKTTWSTKNFEDNRDKRSTRNSNASTSYRPKKYANVADTIDVVESDSDGESSVDEPDESKSITHSTYLATKPNGTSTISFDKNTSDLPLDLLDSGANSSHVNDKTRFNHLREADSFLIQTASGSLIKSSGQNGQVGHIPGVHFTPQFTHNLVSVSKLVQLGYQVVFDESGAIVSDAQDGEVCGTGRLSNGLYFINLHNIAPSKLLFKNKKSPTAAYNSIALIANNVIQDTWSKWHFRLHLPKKSVSKILASGAVDGLDVKHSDMKKPHLNCLSCATCQTDKQPKELGYVYGKPAEVIGGQIVTDVWQMGDEGVGGIIYCIGFIDVFSNYKHIFFTKKKSEAVDKLLQLIDLYRQMGYVIQRMHADNGSEYTAEVDQWRDICRKHQIEYSYSPPYTPKLNRKIERYWRSFGNLTKTRMTESSCPKSYWPYAARYTNYIQNMTKIVVRNGRAQTPHEMFCRRKANLKMVRRWGCVTSVNIDRSLRSKSDPKAVVGYFVDVNEENQTYLVYVPSRQKIVRSADCIFDELNMDLRNSSLMIVNNRTVDLRVNSSTDKACVDTTILDNDACENQDNLRVTDSQQVLPDPCMPSVSPSINPTSNELDENHDNVTSTYCDDCHNSTVHVSGDQAMDVSTATQSEQSANVDECSTTTNSDSQQSDLSAVHQPTVEQSPNVIDSDNVLIGGTHQNNLNRFDFLPEPTSSQDSTMYWTEPLHLISEIVGHSGKWSSIHRMKFRVKWQNSPIITSELYRQIKFNPIFHEYLRKNRHAELIVYESANKSILLESNNQSTIPKFQPHEAATVSLSESSVQPEFLIREFHTTDSAKFKINLNAGLDSLFCSSDQLSENHFFKKPIFMQSETDCEPNEFMEHVEHSKSYMRSSNNVHITNLNGHVALAARDRTGDLDPVEAFKDPAWNQSMNDEFDSVELNETWIPEVMPKGYRSLKAKWVFVEKLNDQNQITRLKSRCTIKGYAQRQGIDFDKTYSPVVRTTTLRILFAFAAINNLKLSQMDVDTAFLNAKFADDEVLYVEPMIGYQARFKKLCTSHGLDSNNKNVKLRLKKALYGLKQAPLAWNRELDTYLKEIGFRPFESEPCLYVKYVGDDIILLPVYVDDFIIAYSNVDVYNEFKEQLMSKYRMKDLGELKQILGMRVLRSDEAICVDQVQYLEKVLADNNIRSNETREYPLSADEITLLAELAACHTEDTVVNQQSNKQYRSIVGCLMYAMLCTRPDLAFAVSTLSRYCNIAGTQQLNVARQVLKYVNHSKLRCLTFSKQSKCPNLCAFVDAGYGSDKVTRRSPTGWVVFFGGSPIAWKSRLQERVTTSSAEAEYTALASVVKELMWIRMIIFNIKLPLPAISATTPIFEDNSSTIMIAENKTVNDRTKHIDEKMHFIREVLLLRQYKLWFVPTKFQIADILTKGLTTDFPLHVENLFSLDTDVNQRFIQIYQQTMLQLKLMEKQYIDEQLNRKRCLKEMNKVNRNI